MAFHFALQCLVVQFQRHGGLATVPTVLFQDLEDQLLLDGCHAFIEPLVQQFHLGERQRPVAGVR